MTLLSSTSAFPLSHSTSFAQSASLVDDKESVLARDFLVKLSPNYAYAIFNDQAAQIKDKRVEVSADPSDAFKLRVDSVLTSRVDRSLLPVYVQAHFEPSDRPAEAHLNQLLTEETLGRHNFDLKKNVTADFFDEVPSHARDECGFLVTDKNLFTYDTFNRQQLAKQLTTRHDLTITRATPTDIDELVQFDNSVSGFNRQSYVEEMSRRSQCLIAREGGSIVGVLFGGDARVFALYGDSTEIAHSLLSHFLSSISSSTVSLFTRVDVWTGSLSSRRVIRRHTRLVPSLIQWSKVFAHNVGMNIV